MNHWDNDSPWYNREKVYNSRRRKATPLSIILSVFIGLLIGLVVLYGSGRLPSSISLIIRGIGVVIAVASPYITPLWKLIERVIPTLRQEFRYENKPALAVISSLVVVITLLASVLFSNVFTNGISFLLSEPPSYLPQNGTLVQNIPMQVSDDKNSQGTAEFICRFTDGTYHALESEQGNTFFTMCKAQQTDYFTNFAFVVKMTILVGNDGGVFFRDQNKNFMYYCLFSIDGRYRLYVHSSKHGYHKLREGSIQGIEQGQANTIAVLAQYNEITVYVNGVSLPPVSDNTYLHGAVGVIGGNNGNVEYSDIQAWTYS